MNKKQQLKEELERARKSLMKCIDKIVDIDKRMSDLDQDIIMVPDNIKIGDRGCIIFNNNRQLLHTRDDTFGVCIISEHFSEPTYPHKLIPVTRDQLEIDQTYHFTDDNQDFDNLTYYGKWNSKGFICIEGVYPSLDCHTYNYYYKCVRCDDE